MDQNASYNWKRDFQSLPPLLLAEHVCELVKKGLEPYEIQNSTYIHTHTQSLSIEAQHLLLGLPDALVAATLVLERPTPQRTLQAARAISVWACEVQYGDEPLSEQWLARALGHALFSPHMLLRRHIFGDSFLSAVRFFAPTSPAPFLYARYGFIFPDIDSIDWIFQAMDSAARRAGGKRILKWCNSETRKTPPNKLPYSLLVNYGAKHIRRAGTHKAMGAILRTAKHLHSLLRLDAPPQMDPIWANPAYLTEDLARGLLHAQLVGTELVRTKDQIALIDHLITELGSSASPRLPLWPSIKSAILTSPGVRIAGKVPDAWVHQAPAPNTDFGVSLESSLAGDLRKRPFIKTSRLISVAPQPSGMGLVEEVAGRLGVKPWELGPHFETFVRRRLSKYRSLLWGDYFTPTESRKHGDIDALLHSNTDKTTIIFELKAINMNHSSWRGGYHTYLDFFRKVFLKSNEQLLRAERALREHGRIILVKGGHRTSLKLHDEARVVRVSISMSSFGALQRPRYGGMLLSHLAQVQVSTNPATHLEDEFTALQQKIIRHREFLATCNAADDLLDSTVFLNMSMFESIVAASSDEAALVRTLRKIQSVPVFSQVLTP